jgi:hypothetical protein
MFSFCGQATNIPFFVDKPQVNCFCQAADLLMIAFIKQLKY